MFTIHTPCIRIHEFLEVRSDIVFFFTLGGLTIFAFATLSLLQDYGTVVCLSTAYIRIHTGHPPRGFF